MYDLLFCWYLTEEEDNVPPLPVDVAPPLPDPDSVDKDEPKPIDTERRTVIQPPVIQKLEKKLKRRKVAKDTSYEDELRRQELAEVRRQRHMDLMEKARSLKQRAGDSWDGDKDGPNFEDCKLYIQQVSCCIVQSTEPDRAELTLQLTHRQFHS